MKWIIFTIIFLLSSCKPYSLENERRPRATNPRVTDKEKGRVKFEIPGIKEIGLDEIRENKDGCINYENHTSKSLVFGDNSPFNPIVNCIAYNIDKGLKPLCDLEKEVKEKLNSTRDRREEEELEIYLDDIGIEKELFIDHIYEIADPVYDYCEDFEDDLDDEIDEVGNSFLRGLLGAATDLTINSECRRIYRVMESKAGLACIDLDFRSKLSFRRRN